MAITADQEALVRRLYHAEKWRMGTIARQLGLHHNTVARVLAAGEEAVVAAQRPSRIDPYIPFIQATLERFPRLPASRLHEMVRERGYAGSASHFRHQVALLRPRPQAEAYLRLATLPGEQAQVDWAHFGSIKVGRAMRRLLAFVMVLSWSRMLFVRFFLDQRMASFLRGHVEAFATFGGVPRICLYDNLKSVVLEREGEAVRFHPTIAALAGHYCFEPRPTAPARGNEKGRVERAIRYVRTAFFAGRAVRDLGELNRQAHTWCQGQAAERRCPGDATLSVREAFEQERSLLVPLPGDAFPTDERVEVAVGKTPYLRFDLNDYSVPHDRVRRTLTVLASLETVRVFDRLELVATHARSFSRSEQIEHPEHVRALEQVKRSARESRGLARLSQAVPETRQLMRRLAERGKNLGSATHLLLGLLDLYGPQELALATREALAKDAPHPHSVRLVLERRARERNVPPPVPVRLPPDPRIRNLVVTPHDLAGYDRLGKETDDDDRS
ncbi:MAG TPA: IS21 family transposase [Planctomycetota bacterium]|nr:IS21 family transposase [Planctomycetota bacterium]